jgi:hypothetical protein
MVRRRDLESGSRRFFGFVVSFLESLEPEDFFGADDSKGTGEAARVVFPPGVSPAGTMSGGFWRNDGHVLGVYPTPFALPSGRSGLFCVLLSNSGKPDLSVPGRFHQVKKNPDR